MKKWEIMEELIICLFFGIKENYFPVAKFCNYKERLGRLGFQYNPPLNSPPIRRLGRPL